MTRRNKVKVLTNSEGIKRLRKGKKKKAKIKERVFHGKMEKPAAFEIPTVPVVLGVCH